MISKEIRQEIKEMAKHAIIILIVFIACLLIAQTLFNYYNHLKP